jgi:hypothetical protein
MIADTGVISWRFTVAGCTVGYSFAAALLMAALSISASRVSDPKNRRIGARNRVSPPLLM